jgi:MFS family permease
VPLAGFGVLFAVAAVSRFYSIRYFVIQSDVKPGSFAVRGLPAVDFLRRRPRGAGAHLLVYMLVLTSTVMIAGPFFSAYMLRQLELPYWTYMTIVGTSLAAKVVALPLLGRLARRWGLVALLRIAWVGITPMAALWLVSERVEYLIALQVVSGVAWAAHEYATFLLLFDTIRAERRTTVLTAYNLGNALATVGGSVAGGALFDACGGGLVGYRALFAASSLSRAACLVLLVRVQAAGLPSFRPAFRLIAANPVMGAVLRPILATVRPRRLPAEPTSPATSGAIAAEPRGESDLRRDNEATATYPPSR